ncbi:MAG: ABC transporter ATP-binding protein [Jaaginema sp. PMC 1079.18]|nr:ABC transporter ATP-binding protein [Jaaginema sp. PMC 1080.18]MEC4852269.1 ABC transporter ATP-binding protein [Jaaginema sp. PMC 1079.18]MEC4867899.1 ABC transporter ATP-binding protein [Jaaginema sp. PMC 1078.18]
MAQTVLSDSRSSATTDSLWDVELRQLVKVFDGESAVKGVDLAIRRGEFFSILGPSGCGKTTILRTIAGFERPTSGEVRIHQQLVNDVPPYRRPVNTVFQSYALFSHLTVADNIAFGLRIQRLPKAEIAERVQEAIASVQLSAMANRYPHQLSGGQRQRVALARALINRPAVLLLDEPLGALDLKLRKEMQVELSRLHQELGLTFVMVTHDQEEALSLSNRIAVLRSGSIEQVGTPQEIYERPQTAFVADFIGDTNLFGGEVTKSEAGVLWVKGDRGLSLAVAASPPDTQKVAVSVRPENIEMSLEPWERPYNCFEGRLQHVMYLGTHVQYVVALAGGEMVTVMQPKPSSIPQPNTQIYLYWSPEDCLALPV